MESILKHYEKKNKNTLRETAKAIWSISTIFKRSGEGRKSTLTNERIEKLARFLVLTETQTYTLYDMAAEARTANDVLIPQDCVDFASNPYVVEALRLSKETGAGEAEWQILLDELRARKG